MASGAKNKAKDRQSRKRKLYYTQQYDRTVINKIITQARHVANSSFYKHMPRAKDALGRLRQMDKIHLKRAHDKAKSPRVRDTLYLALASSR